MDSRMAPITVAIPSIPARARSGGLLDRAMMSVQRQNLAPARVIVQLDTKGEGAAVTRNKLLERVTTPWVAFLDDDDLMYPRHLEALWELAQGDAAADYAWSWFDGSNPFPQHRGRQMDLSDPHHTTMTILVRTELAREVGFRLDHPPGWELPQEDWRFILDMVELGKAGRCTFAGTPEITWHYRLHAGNSCGLPTRGDGLASR